MNNNMINAELEKVKNIKANLIQSTLNVQPLNKNLNKKSTSVSNASSASKSVRKSVELNPSSPRKTKAAASNTASSSISVEKSTAACILLNEIGLDSSNEVSTAQEITTAPESELESIKLMILRAVYDLRSNIDDKFKELNLQINALAETNAELVEFYKTHSAKKSNSNAPIVSLYNLIYHSLKRQFLIVNVKLFYLD